MPFAGPVSRLLLLLLLLRPLLLLRLSQAPAEHSDDSGPITQVGGRTGSKSEFRVDEITISVVRRRFA